jgi:hypothetical protein
MLFLVTGVPATGICLVTRRSSLLLRTPPGLQEDTGRAEAFRPRPWLHRRPSSVSLHVAWPSVVPVSFGTMTRELLRVPAAAEPPQPPRATAIRRAASWNRTVTTSPTSYVRSGHRHAFPAIGSVAIRSSESPPEGSRCKRAWSRPQIRCVSAIDGSADLSALVTGRVTASASWHGGGG